MRITAPVTDYIRESVLTTQGDLVVRGAALVERLAAAATGKVLTAQGVGAKPIYKALYDLLTTQGDLWVRGATDPQRLAGGVLKTYLKGMGAGVLPAYGKVSLGDTGVKLGWKSRSSSGDQLVAGIGFQPSAIIFFAYDSTGTNLNLCWGLYANAVNHCMFFYDSLANSFGSTTKCIRIRRDAGNILEGNVSAVAASSFTITWTETGSVALNYYYLCLP